MKLISALNLFVLLSHTGHLPADARLRRTRGVRRASTTTTANGNGNLQRKLQERAKDKMKVENEVDRLVDVGGNNAVVEVGGNNVDEDTTFAMTEDGAPMFLGEEAENWDFTDPEDEGNRADDASPTYAIDLEAPAAGETVEDTLVVEDNAGHGGKNDEGKGNDNGAEAFVLVEDESTTAEVFDYYDAGSTNIVEDNAGHGGKNDKDKGNDNGEEALVLVENESTTAEVFDNTYNDYDALSANKVEDNAGKGGKNDKGKGNGDGSEALVLVEDGSTTAEVFDNTSTNIATYDEEMGVETIYEANDVALVVAEEEGGKGGKGGKGKGVGTDNEEGLALVEEVAQNDNTYNDYEGLSTNEALGVETMEEDATLVADEEEGGKGGKGKGFGADNEAQQIGLIVDETLVEEHTFEGEVVARPDTNYEPEPLLVKNNTIYESLLASNRTILDYDSLVPSSNVYDDSKTIEDQEDDSDLIVDDGSNSSNEVETLAQLKARVNSLEIEVDTLRTISESVPDLQLLLELALKTIALHEKSISDLSATVYGTPSDQFYEYEAPDHITGLSLASAPKLGSP